MQEGWSAEREQQVLDYFRQRRHTAGYLASSRCPNDGRLLGAISRFPDGIWIWMAGSRLSPEVSRRELRSEYLDMFDETEWTSEVYEQASQYADEELREWGGRLGWDPTVMKIVVRGLDDPIELANRQFPEGSPGLALVRTVTCGCRTQYMLPVYALVYAGIRACIGIAKPGTHVRPMPPREPSEPRPPGESMYLFMAGKMLVDVHER